MPNDDLLKRADAVIATATQTTPTAPDVDPWPMLVHADDPLDALRQVAPPAADQLAKWTPTAIQVSIDRAEELRDLAKDEMAHEAGLSVHAIKQIQARNDPAENLKLAKAQIRRQEVLAEAGIRSPDDADALIDRLLARAVAARQQRARDMLADVVAQLPAAFAAEYARRSWPAPE